MVLQGADDVNSPVLGKTGCHWMSVEEWRDEFAQQGRRR
jgi:hypothetical protein